MASRIRLRAMQDAADRELHASLVEALRHLEKAESFCGRVLHSRDEESRVSAGRARKYAQDIRKARCLLEGIGSLINPIDYEEAEREADIARKKAIEDARRRKHGTTEE